MDDNERGRWSWQYIDASNLPKEYGGSDPTPVGKSPQELQLREHVMKILNEQHEALMPLPPGDATNGAGDERWGPGLM
jgi:hypothetical protein